MESNWRGGWVQCLISHDTKGERSGYRRGSYNIALCVEGHIAGLRS
jgi:hypothetical protein